MASYHVSTGLSQSKPGSVMSSSATSSTSLHSQINNHEKIHLNTRAHVASTYEAFTTDFSHSRSSSGHGHRSGDHTATSSASSLDVQDICVHPIVIAYGSRLGSDAEFLHMGAQFYSASSLGGDVSARFRQGPSSTINNGPGSGAHTYEDTIMIQIDQYQQHDATAAMTEVEHADAGREMIEVEN